MRDGGTQHEGDGDAHDFRDRQAQWEPGSRCVQARRERSSEPAGDKGPDNDEEPLRSFTYVVTLPAEDYESAKADAVQDRGCGDLYRQPGASALQLGRRLTTTTAIRSSR